MEHTMQIVLMAVEGVLTLVVGYASYKFNQYRHAEEVRERKEIARDRLQLAVARCTLIRECNHYIKKKYAPLYALDSITEMYNAYHESGGNGAITEIYQEFLKLPHTPSEGV